MSLISVIVPVYKVESYLQECIDSILAQTYTNFELILVDDGSPDNCGLICDQAAERDERVRVLHQKNQGVTRARANGVAASTGEFVTFVDGDDTFPPHALATLITPVNEGVDIIVGGVQNYKNEFEGYLSHEKYCEMCIMMREIHVGPWSKLYRRRLFNEFVFNLPPELRIGEDAIMNMRIAYNAQGEVFVTNKVVYNYRDNPESVTHTRTVDIENQLIFQQSRLKTIPEKDLEYYINKGLYNDIILQWMAPFCKSGKLSPDVLKFHDYIHKIKNQTNIRFGLYARVLFYCKNSVLRIFFISCRNLWYRIKNRFIQSKN